MPQELIRSHSGCSYGSRLCAVNNQEITARQHVPHSYAFTCRSDRVIYRNSFKHGSNEQIGDEILVHAVKPPENSEGSELLLAEEAKKQQLIKNAEESRYARKEQEELCKSLGGYNYSALIRGKMVEKAEMRLDTKKVVGSAETQQPEEQGANLYKPVYYARPISTVRRGRPSGGEPGHSGQEDGSKIGGICSNNRRSAELASLVDEPTDESNHFTDETTTYSTVGMFEKVKTAAVKKCDKGGFDLARAESILMRKSSVNHLQLSSTYNQRCRSRKQDEQSSEPKENFTISELK